MVAPAKSTAGLIDEPPAIAKRIKQLEGELKLARRLLRLSIAARLQQLPAATSDTNREVPCAAR